MIIKLAFLNLRFKRFRSFITVLGVIIGIGSIYLLVSFGQGLQQLVQSQVAGNQAINTVDISSTNSAILTLSPENVRQIQSMTHVTSVSGTYMFASQVTLNGSSVDLVAYGIDSNYLTVSNLTLKSGRLIDATKNDELIINSSLLEAIGVKDTQSIIGKEMSVKFTPTDGKVIDKKMRIVGVVNAETGSEIFVSQKVFQEAGVTNFTQAKAIIDDRSSAESVRHGIESLGFQTSSPVDTLNQINDVFRYFNLILVGFGSIGLIIAVLGMINTLTVSLIERTREIALMMAIGARPKDMQRLFTAEAVMLSLTGGIIGILLAGSLGLVINASLNQFARTRGVVDSFVIFSTSPLLILGMLVFMMTIGVLVSLVPARRAAHINPIEALHQE